MSAEREEPGEVGPRVRALVDHFFRHESGRLHGALVRRFGVRNLGLVEDAAQEALRKAMHAWSIGGVPANPSAWITRVAMNHALDALRHLRMAVEVEPRVVAHFEQLRPEAAVVAPDEIADDALRLLFVCCHPVLAHEAQVVLALKILCGFGNGEIARAFFSTEAAIEKQLTRAKLRLREAGVGFEVPAGPDLVARLDGVLATLHLLFNEGYKASSGDRLLREDLCDEAIRLVTILVGHPVGDVPRAHALRALMLLHAARFPARTDAGGVLLTLEAQDRSCWDADRLDAGLHALARAAHGDELGEYHLLAGIVALHAAATDNASTDRAAIVRHYDRLLLLRPSPLVALNRAVAIAQLHGPGAGLEAVASIEGLERLDALHLRHAVEGELHLRFGDRAAAAESLRRALGLARVGPERDHIARMLARC